MLVCIVIQVDGTTMFIDLPFFLCYGGMYSSKICGDEMNVGDNMRYNKTTVGWWYGVVHFDAARI